mmetsp:Transcript_10502/g.15785  ORF Transcript_10502/g.15785 Transcript_10502/m.15785 type:complete len:294 (-) Transcript_10502:569-1450(-)
MSKDFYRRRSCHKNFNDDSMIVNSIPPNKIMDGYPFLFKNPKSTASALVCLAEKVASSTWKSFFIKTLEHKVFESEIRKGADPHFVKFKESQNILSQKSIKVIADAILNPNIPRIMFTREPYSRALSGYIDKVVDSDEHPFNFHPGLPRTASFIEFTQYLSERKSINEHFLPLTERCMLPMGMRYDYYLKIETMPHWYEALIDLLELVDETSSGWDYTSYWRPATNGETPEKCFYTPPGKTCKDMFQYTVTAITMSQEGVFYHNNTIKLLFSVLNSDDNNLVCIAIHCGVVVT